MELNDIDLTPFREQYSSFAAQMLHDLGMSDLQQPLRGQLLSSADQYLNQVLLHTILINITPATAERIKELTESDKPNDEIIAYLISSTPGLQRRIQEALQEGYANLVAEVRQLTKEVARDFANDPKNSAETNSASQ